MIRCRFVGPWNESDIIICACPSETRKEIDSIRVKLSAQGLNLLFDREFFTFRSSDKAVTDLDSWTVSADGTRRPAFPTHRLYTFF